MEIRLEKPAQKLTGGKNEKPRWGILKQKTSVRLIVC